MWNSYQKRCGVRHGIRPLTRARLAVVQLVVLLAGHVAGAVVLAQRPSGSRVPATVALALLMGMATGIIVLAPGL